MDIREQTEANSSLDQRAGLVPESSSQTKPGKYLPLIPDVLVKRSATVNICPKDFPWWIWSRRYIRLTNHTLSLHRTNLKDSPALEIIVLSKVIRVDRVNVKSRCLQIETTEHQQYFFDFENEDELYAWLTDIHMRVSTVGEPTNFQHITHVTVDKEDKSRLIGLPKLWLDASYYMAHGGITRQMIETALPEISPSSQEPFIDLDASISIGDLPSPQLHLTSDERDRAIPGSSEAIITPTQHLQANTETPLLKLAVQDVSAQPSTPMDSSASNVISSDRGRCLGLVSTSAPLLTPGSFLPTPFRESPYNYRDSDAQNLSGQIHRQSQWANAHGSYADIWHAQWQIDTGKCFPVAVKVLRVHSEDPDIQLKIQTRLRNEVRVWHQLRHKNVVQMFGVCDGFGPFVSMVSLWCKNGNVNAYLRKLGEGATIERRLKLLTEVAAGLNYLHNFAVPVVHGDVKGANILVNDQGEAALADFGLSSILEAEGSATSTGPCGSVRWMAPELLQLSPYNVTPTTCASDTYSYGSVILEILTGERPYKDISNDMQVISQLIRGSKPKRPSKPIVDPGIWDLMERCWKTEATERPCMALILSRMEKFYGERRKSILSRPMDILPTT